MESILSMAPALLNRVRELRQARNWTQEDLAALTGVSRQSINSIERDRYIPSLPLALTFARVFACPVEQIFTLNSQPDPEAQPADNQPEPNP
jgi:putative transcriptional regulator